jgi:flagellar basal-body rod modification protein FlgD
MNVINHVNHPLFAVPGIIPKSASPFDSSANGASGTGTTSGSSSANSSSSASSSANSLIDPNSFITLLTTQLQAQDPTNPLDPTQLVSQLISMNTLQQTIQIQQDLATLDSLASGGTTGTTGTTGTSGAATGNAGATAAAAAANTSGSAASTLAALSNAFLNGSFASPSSAAAALYSNASQTPLF